MIRYTLKCEEEHSFDSWFQSAGAFDKLSMSGLISCSVCGSENIQKAVMAPGVRPGRKAAQTAEAFARPLSAPASPAEQALKEMRKKIEATSEDVGRDFAREARAIHEGEAPARAIIGEVAPDEAHRLIRDGVPVAPLPWSSRKAN